MSKINPVRPTPLTLTPQFEARLLATAEKLNLSIKNVTAISQQIIETSNYYLENPGAKTPWQNPATLAATLLYFMPLNFIRMSDAIREIHRTFNLDTISEIWDFGSGLGTTHWVLEDQDWLSVRPLYCVESAAAATRVHQVMEKITPSRWQAEFPPRPHHPKAGALGVFCYSYLEIKSVHLEFDHLLIVEPSTRDGGRQLMAARAEFQSQGYSALAPCTHDLSCPLLSQSPRDWCHQRIAFSAPDWWTEIEKHLPMSNQTLTYSYLLMSRLNPRPHEVSKRARVIGDTLHEKGKTRQMICRGQQREFLAWLHKVIEPEFIPHGALVTLPEPCEKKSDEIRLSSSLEWIYGVQSEIKARE